MAAKFQASPGSGRRASIPPPRKGEPVCEKEDRHPVVAQKEGEMIRRRVLIAVLVSAVTALAAGAPSAQAAPPTTSITATLSGTCSFLDTTTNQLVNGTLSGTLGVTQFTASGGQLFATGTIDATCTAVNGLGQTVTKTVT